MKLNRDMVIMVGGLRLVLVLRLVMAGITDIQISDRTPEEEDGVVVKNKAESLFRENYPRLRQL